MDVRVSSPVDELVDRATVVANAYEVYWDCVEDDLATVTSCVTVCAEDAYARYWMDSDD